MNTWEMLETLSHPETTPDERTILEQQLKKDPRLKEILATFRVLQSWPYCEVAAREDRDPRVILQRLEDEWEAEARDRELGRIFPWVAAASLAAAIVLGLLNIGAMSETTSGPIDALLGLPQASIDNLFLADQ